MSLSIPAEVLEIFREEATDLLRSATSAVQEVQRTEGAGQVKALGELKRLLHTLKGAAAAAGQVEIEHAAHAIEDQLAEASGRLDHERVELLFAALERVEAMLWGGASSAGDEPPARGSTELAEAPKASSLEEQKQSLRSSAVPADETQERRDSASPAVPDPMAQQWLRVPPRRVDQLEAQVGELVLTRLRNEELADELLSLRNTLSRALSRERQLHKALGEVRPHLPAEHWTRLRALTQDTQRGFQEFQARLSNLCRSAPMLQAQASLASQTVEESIQELRLMPLRPFFERVSSSARDAARRTGKQLQIVVDADGAEVDRSILLVLNDALLHLVRNAVVHGIEAPEQRRAAGKPEAGVLRLAAAARGTHVDVVVEDDGAGVDVPRVVEKANSLGIPAAEQRDVLELLTHPGMSTRDRVDDLAGRGVGLDVCAHTLRNLSGEIALWTEPGRGSRFTLRVPLRASTSLGILLAVDGRKFGMLLSTVERVVRPAASDYRELQGRMALELDGDVISVAWLADLVGLKRPASARGRAPVVVLEHGRRRLGVIVDEIPGQAAMVIRRLGRAFRRADLFSGAAVQADHSVVPILNPAALFGRAAKRSTKFESMEAGGNERRLDLRALVVDDSVTMRTLIRNILDAAGYDVSVAENGLSALETLSAMERCDIVVTDLQMPEMDGIELCAAIRARNAPYVPIVMVTSVADDSERRKALTAGADAYVVKAAFEQGSFLERVNTLVRGPQEQSA